jgi:hypothetical protein
MGKQDSPAVSGEVIVPERGLASLSSAGLASIQAMLSCVPQSDAGGVENIIAAIAQATSVEELDSPWESWKASELVNTPIRIQSATQAESDFEGGLGVFLVVRASILASGEVVTFMAGSAAIVAQIAQAYAIDQANPGKGLPFNAKIVEAGQAQPGQNAALRLQIIK